MQELLRVVGLRGDAGALAELQHRLLGGGPVATGARHEHRTPRTGAHVLSKRRGDGVGKPGDVVAADCVDRRDGARIADGVAPRTLELGRRDDHLGGELGER